MAIAIITGSAGLIGSEAAQYFHEKGYDIIGIDNDMRSYFFGSGASTAWNTKQLKSKLKNFSFHNIDIRDHQAIDKIFKSHAQSIELIIHTAAQPSHDWAAKEPLTDFSVNATGTLHLLESMRTHCPNAAFIFTSTNKVYGDLPNQLPLIEQETRWECSNEHPYAEFGIDESMSLDQSTHSVFGASKVAADIMVQEYGRYFGLRTAAFRGGCLTGPAHSGAELHGFLAYLVQCVVTGKAYSIFGYKGKQVRDNIHAHDLITAFDHYSQNPRCGEVYNIGGSRHSQCSMLEAINMTEKLVGKKLNFTLKEQNRIGDHIWWISDVRKFQSHYPNWKYKYNVEDILRDIVEATLEKYRGHNETLSVNTRP